MRRKLDITLRTLCRDCGLDTTVSGDWYMVRDEVWSASGLKPEDGVLCIRCLEHRLGRELTRADFMPADTGARDFWRSDLMLPRRWRHRYSPQMELPF